MKIIRVKSFAPTFDVDIHPDSAMMLPGRPFFMPEWDEEWVARLHPAVRIGRLGKNISKKFAPRYYDGVCMALRMRPAGIAGMEGVVSGMDSTLIHGEWLPKELCETAVTVEMAGADICLGPLEDSVVEAIADISRFMTLKMGDIVLLPPVAEPVKIEEGCRLKISVNGTENLELRVV
ncbi:MAG: fumarylacetoacetate hydrolase family protein [Bacteroides sp.]|nr:fumarylacetoacetate hydrolase family protein [Bacteroides sp.]